MPRMRNPGRDSPVTVSASQSSSSPASATSSTVSSPPSSPTPLHVRTSEFLRTGFEYIPKKTYSIVHLASLFSHSSQLMRCHKSIKKLHVPDLQIPEVVGEPQSECSPISGFADDSSFELPADAAQGWTWQKFSLVFKHIQEMTAFCIVDIT